MELIGTVVRLQVQRGRLKPGERGARVYDPTPLLEVEALDVGPVGVHGLLGEDRIVDVHHADHPETRNVQLLNGISVMTTARYGDLRQRFGARLVDGIAGESVLLDAATLDLSGPVALETDQGRLALTAVPIPPCVEFSRWVLGRDVTDTGPEVLAAMDALADGARGFWLQGPGEGVVRHGHRMHRLLRP